MAKASLESAAREFAGGLSTLLNSTVCDGIKISALVGPSRDRVVLGFGLTKGNPQLRAIPLRISSAEPRAYLKINFSLSLGPHGYLTVEESVFGLYLDAEFERLLVHWDYVREPQRGYPRAHVQIHGCSENFASLFATSFYGSTAPAAHSELPRLHFPVGGRRFRPSLEDVIEFAIYHGMCEVRPLARERLEASRQSFDEIQLRAAVRRHPDVALEVLRETGRA